VSRAAKVASNALVEWVWVEEQENQLLHFRKKLLHGEFAIGEAWRAKPMISA